MAVDTIIQAAARIAGTITGIAKAWDKQPESLNELPAVLFVPFTGTIPFPRRPSIRETTHQIKLIVLFSRADLTQADLNARPFIATFITTFDHNITLQGTAGNSGLTRYHYGHIEYAGVTYLGIEFILEAVDREIANYAP